jgi:hemerythrin-like domain-containing protein
MDGLATKRPAPRIPRGDWTTHPRYPEQVLLLGSHENFRGLSRRLMDQIADDPDAVGPVSYVFDRWLSAMHSHEGYEEHKLYPYLESRYETSCDPLREGHETLHRLEAKFREASKADDTGTRDADAALAALQSFDRALNEHLDAEEELVIPMLLELSPSEFYRYAASPIWALLDRDGD